ncbi:hypothetical protein HGRIS_005693 [Hohenbuehelia grisea]
MNGLERTVSSPSAMSPSASTLKTPDVNARNSGSFTKMSFSSMMGGLSNLSLTRTSTNNSATNVSTSAADDSKGKDKESRGRTMFKVKTSRSVSATTRESSASRSRSRARSQSPFSFRRFRKEREPSPPPQAIPLASSDIDVSDSSSVQPRTAFADDDSGDETVGETDGETDDDDILDDDLFDPITEANTEQNAIIAPAPLAEGTIHGLDEADVDPDPLGEGVNVVVPPEPYFPSSLNSLGSGGTIRGKRGPRRRRSTRHHEPLPMQTSRPIFLRDRCTITITQGDPDAKLGGRKMRKYVVASDLSEESRYAVEWGIGTVLRDGDAMLIVTVVENDAKVDPPIPNAADRTAKLRSQQERQGMAYILARQATSLLQRTKLNVTVSCQAWHAKNARHMLLDIVDYNEPTMLIVGSRGLSHLKGILLGSTSHYLIQVCLIQCFSRLHDLTARSCCSEMLGPGYGRKASAQAPTEAIRAPREAQNTRVARRSRHRSCRRQGRPRRQGHARRDAA